MMLVLRPSVPPARCSRAGFTLLELLVAITVLGLMMPLLYAVMQTGAHAWVRSQSHFHHTNKVLSVQTYLQRQIRQIYPSYQSAGTTNARIEFEGGKDAVQFLVPALEVGQDGGMALTRLALVQDGTTLQLVMTQKPELAWEETSQPTRTTLVKELKSGALSYFGADDLQQVPTWHDTWTSRKELPKLIRLQASFIDGGQVWPDLIVSPQITVDVGCLYDPLTKYCQGR